ncbi:MAG: serine/threonine protein kinase [Myxococcales bacterium]|jgi:serine/threonine-protein kinase|nr:serine/threonine protein kinase [Myxococcales bacterium]HQY65146.1 serine/threonine-protein kinase [Polyangiaceae bacterium]
MTERTGATRSDVADPLIGRTINDRFRITRLIARGGMGKVYLAEQSPLGRLCAIKVLNPSYNGGAEPEFHKRFFLEASVTSRLSHPNTVTIFDYGVTEDDYYFMAMEYLEGQTLYQAIRRDGFITEERAVNIVSQICRGLREAHAIGVIHRDLKPANIFLVKHGDESDFVKILDFGLVKNVLEKAEDQITQTGLFMGSPKYMAPEQIHGAAVDARTDIYSLGVVLCELLTGKVPFDRATSVSILMAHVSESPPPLAELKPDIVASIEVEDIVHRCLAKNPDDRYASMDDLLLALRVAAGVSVTGQVSAFPLGAGASGSQRVVRRAAASGSGGIAIRQAPAVVASAAPQSQTPLSLSHDEVPRREARRSSKYVLPVAVAIAAAAGGLGGLAAYKLSMSPSPPVARPVVAAPQPTPAPSPSQAPPPSASGPAQVRQTQLQVVSEPPGASVRRDGVVLCKATPCSILLTGDDASPERVLSLLVQKPPRKPVPVEARVGDGKVHVQLDGPTPAGKPQAPPPTPSGYKGAY